jgi:hypothetical protein
MAKVTSSARAKKAARSGDLKALRAEVEKGKAGADLLQIGSAHDAVVKLLLGAGVDPDEVVHSREDEVVAKTFRQLAEMVRDDGDDSLIALLGDRADGAATADPVEGRWVCMFALSEEESEVIDDVIERLTGSELRFASGRCTDIVFGVEHDQAYTVDGEHVALEMTEERLRVGERGGRPVLVRDYHDEEHGWDVTMYYRKR